MKMRCGTGSMICKNVGKQNNTTQNRKEKQPDTFRHFFRVEWFLPAPYNKKGKTRKRTKNVAMPCSKEEFLWNVRFHPWSGSFLPSPGCSRHIRWYTPFTRPEQPAVVCRYAVPAAARAWTARLAAGPSEPRSSPTSCSDFPASLPASTISATGKNTEPLSSASL